MQLNYPYGSLCCYIIFSMSHYYSKKLVQINNSDQFCPKNHGIENNSPVLPHRPLYVFSFILGINLQCRNRLNHSSVFYDNYGADRDIRPMN
jgi:hypothetical protein